LPIKPNPEQTFLTLLVLVLSLLKQEKKERKQVLPSPSLMTKVQSYNSLEVGNVEGSFPKQSGVHVAKGLCLSLDDIYKDDKSSTY
jgi:hypothetical protein